MTNLATKGGVLAFCKIKRDEMTEQFLREGRYEVNGYSFMGWVFATHDVQIGSIASAGLATGRKLAAVTPYPCRMPAELCDLIPGDEHTSVFSKFLSEFATAMRSVGTMIMSEAWAAECGPEQTRDDLPDNLEHAPNRREQLFMILDHDAVGQCAWRATIRRNPDRVEEWEPLPFELMQGRLVSLRKGAGS